MKTVTKSSFSIITILLFCVDITSQKRTIGTYLDDVLFTSYFYRNMYYQ